MHDNNENPIRINDSNDAELYAFMKANFPKGGQMISEEEKEAFMKKHGIGKFREKK
ncbi:MAG: hypothetical protein NC453_29310 [Muribaculum sp.]|nr:hypothetical protein [Muribaculum sp.]